MPDEPRRNALEQEVEGMSFEVDVVCGSPPRAFRPTVSVTFDTVTRLVIACEVERPSKEA